MNDQETIKMLRENKMGAANADAMADLLENQQDLHPALENWVFSTQIGEMVKHPFVFTHYGHGLFAKAANDMYAWKIKVRREYLDKKNWHGYLMSFERPYRMRALGKLFYRGKISRAEFPALLADTWRDCEMPQANQDEPLELFREAVFTTDDPETWAKLSKQKTIKLYRGVDYHAELTADGPSWTRSIKTAKFFAYRYGAKGDVFTYTARPDEVLAYLGGRDESECILDFDNTSDSDRIRKLP